MFDDDDFELLKTVAGVAVIYRSVNTNTCGKDGKVKVYETSKIRFNTNAVFTT